MRVEEGLTASRVLWSGIATPNSPMFSRGGGRASQRPRAYSGHLPEEYKKYRQLCVVVSDCTCTAPRPVTDRVY